MGPELALLAALAGAYDPVIDTQVKPRAGLALDAGVQRLHDDFGLTLGVSSPRWLDGRLGARLAVGLGWYPDLRALPASVGEEAAGAWSLYGHGRLLLEWSMPIAVPVGRLYVAAGPSLLVLDSRLSTTRASIGGYGVAGIEIFAGDGQQTFPVAFFFELGGTAHTAEADVERRTGAPEEADTSVNRPIGTGFAMSGGVRFYFGR